MTHVFWFFPLFLSSSSSSSSCCACGGVGTGCCEEGVQYDCSRCSEENECCDRYEHCVSCCMGKSVVDEYMKAPDVFKVALHPETGHWEKRWDYCTGQCRITPLATIYENRYKDAFKFCYAKYPMPKNTYLQLPTGLSVEMGLRGQSCDQVCREKGKTCKEEHFSKINLCEVTQEHTGFKCRFCKMKKGPPEIGGPAVQYMAGSEYFDGTCFQEKQLYNFKCELEVVEAFNRICPCG